MPTLERKDLARGVKLVVGHVFDSLSTVATWLKTSTVLLDKDQLEEGYARTRIVWNVPCFFSHEGKPTPFPFLLPPLQQFFDSGFNVGVATPEVSVVDVQFSFDQRGEGALITGDGHVSGVGLLDYNSWDGVNFSVALMEKPLNITETTNTFGLSRELFSLELPAAEAMAVRDQSFNPFRIDVSTQINPYRLYVLVFTAVGLGGAGFRHSLPAFQLTLTLRHRLVARTSDAQNIPTAATGKVAESAATVDPTVPAPNDNVFAGGSTLFPVAGAGVQANLQKLEAVFRRRLYGGRYKDGGVPVVEHLLHDSAYEVIAVPLWGNFNAGRISVADTTQPRMLPYVGPSPYADETGVRVPIFLHYPLLVHHVFVMVNYGAEVGGGLFPTSPTFSNEVALVMGTGLRGDYASYADVAVLSWTPATRYDRSVDRLSMQNNWSAEDWDWDILNVPLVGAGGVGFYAQGKPVYAGKASSRYTARSNLAGGVASTLGLEQWLECRWTFHDPIGLSSSRAGLPAISGNEVYVGELGHWMLLICEKAAVGGDRDVRV